MAATTREPAERFGPHLGRCVVDLDGRRYPGECVGPLTEYDQELALTWYRVNLDGVDIFGRRHLDVALSRLRPVPVGSDGV